MDVFTSIVLFALIWWTVLFAVLPFGTRPVSEADPETGWRGAPARPLMLRKLLATSVVTLVLWGVGMVIIRSTWWSFRS